MPENILESSSIVSPSLDLYRNIEPDAVEWDNLVNVCEQFPHIKIKILTIIRSGISLAVTHKISKTKMANAYYRLEDIDAFCSFLKELIIFQDFEEEEHNDDYNYELKSLSWRYIQNSGIKPELILESYFKYGIESFAIGGKDIKFTFTQVIEYLKNNSYNEFNSSIFSGLNNAEIAKLLELTSSENVPIETIFQGAIIDGKYVNATVSLVNFILEYLDAPEKISRCKFYISPNILAKIGKRLHDSGIKLPAGHGLRLFKILLPVCVSKYNNEIHSIETLLTKNTLSALSIDTSEVYNMCLDAELRGLPLITLRAPTDWHDKWILNGLTINFVIEDLLKIYNASKEDQRLVIEAAILQEHSSNISNAMFFINDLRIKYYTNILTEEKFPRWYPCLWVNDLITNLMDLCCDKDLINDVNSFKDLIVKHFGVSHTISKAASILNNISLDSENARLKASNIISWLMRVAFNYISDEVRCDIISNSQQENVLHDLVHLPDDKQRTLFTQMFFIACKDKYRSEFLRETLGEKKNISFIALSLTPLAKNYKLQALKLISLFKKDYKDSKAAMIAVGALNKIFASSDLDMEAKLSILQTAMDPMPVIISGQIVASGNSSAKMLAKYLTETSLVDNKSAFIVMPSRVNGKNDLVLSYINKSSRCLIFANNNLKTKPLTDQIFAYIQRPTSAIVKATSTLMNADLLSSQFKRELGLLCALTALADLKLLQKLQNLLKHTSIDEAVLAATLEFLEINTDQMARSEYVNNILPQHDSAALLPYASRLKGCPQYYSLFKLFLQRVLTPQACEYYAQRYNVVNNPHLQLIAASSDILERWKQNQIMDLAEFNMAQQISSTPDKGIVISDFLYSRIVMHKHLPHEKFALLVNWLLAKQELNLSKTIAVEQKIAAISEEHSNIREFMLEFVKLYNSTDDSLAKKIKNILNVRRLLTQIDQNLELINDFSYLLRSYRALSQVTFSIMNVENYTLQFTDNYWLMLMLGTDVDGSCQRIYSINTYLNKHLIVYVMAPHIKTIAIVTPEGRIAARAIIRLGFDGIEKAPVAHLEAIYFAAGVPRYLEKSIYGYAEKICRDVLGCTLVTLEDVREGLEAYPNPIAITFIPEQASEYVDAKRGPCGPSYVLDLPRPRMLFDYAKHRAAVLINTTVEENSCDTATEKATLKLV